MNVIGIDPGPVESALVEWDGRVIVNAIHQPNEFILERLMNAWARTVPLVIEKMACYGMAVGAEVFETVYWSGRFAQAYTPGGTYRITRGEVKMHLCHSMKAKDGNIRQALIDRFGVQGTKKNPGPLYGVSGDLWAALAVAVTWWDLNIKAIPDLCSTAVGEDRRGLVE
jgi:hypothetical protein